jgi:hypothetical protein
MITNAALFGLTNAQRLAEEDENADRMYQLNHKDGPTPYQPIGPSRPVRRGATWHNCSLFIWLSMERNRRLT